MSSDALSFIFRLIEKGYNGMIYEKIAEDNSAYLLGMPQTVIAEKQEIEDSLSWYENLIGEKNNNEGSKTIEKVAFL